MSLDDCSPLLPSEEAWQAEHREDKHVDRTIPLPRLKSQFSWWFCHAIAFTFPSPSSNFRAPARPGSVAALRLVELVQYHDTIVLVDCVLRKRFALLARTDRSLLLLSLGLLVQPLLTNSVLGGVL